MNRARYARKPDTTAEAADEKLRARVMELRTMSAGRESARCGAVQLQVLALLKQTGPLTVEEVYAKTGLYTIAQTVNAMAGLIARNLVVKSGERSWRAA